VGVFAPSGNFAPQRLEAGLALIRSWGLEPVLAPGLGRRARYLAGAADLRLADMLWALGEPELDAAWMARGGFGLTRLLHRVPWSRLPRRPVIGFSDASALFAGLWAHRVGLPIHGPVLQSLADLADEGSQRALRELLLGSAPVRWSGRSLHPGDAEGPLVGGNLCTLASLAGTPSALRPEGCIVLLEEVGERPYRVDRLLTQLLRSGGLDGVAGLVLGELLDCQESGRPEWSSEAIAGEILAELGVPVLAGIPVGHGPVNRAFPWGVEARIEGDALAWG